MSALHFTVDNFEQEVLQAKEPVLVDFWAEWCGPCQSFGPVVEAVSDTFAGKAKVGKVNVDDNKELSKTYRVFSIPTMIVFKDGKAVFQEAGVKTEEEVAEILNRFL